MGMGLGLSMVVGLAKQSLGTVRVNTERHGISVTIYPRGRIRVRLLWRGSAFHERRTTK